MENVVLAYTKVYDAERFDFHLIEDEPDSVFHTKTGWMTNGEHLFIRVFDGNEKRVFDTKKFDNERDALGEALRIWRIKVACETPIKSNQNLR